MSQLPMTMPSLSHQSPMTMPMPMPMPMPMMPSLSPRSRLRWASMPISSLSPHSPLRIACSRSVGLPPQILPTDGQLIFRSKKEVMDSPGPSKKVYFVCTSSSYGVLRHNPGSLRCIFCVDLQSEGYSDGFNLLRPKVRLRDRAFDGAAFCVFESTLYVFQDFNEGKSIYCYNLEADVSDLNLEKRMMEEVCSMKTLKYAPRAVPTPNGKNILVFSCLCGNFDFELFNLEKGICEKLPRISCDEDYASIYSYTFLGNYVLLVQVELESHEKMSCILDFRSGSWKTCLGSFKNSLHFHSLILGNEVCLTRKAGYHIDIGDASINEVSRWCYLFPETSSLPDGFRSDSITLIAGEDENGVCEFCIFRLNKRENEDEPGFKYIPHIILDVYRCDVNVCKEEMKKINELKRGEDEDYLTLPGAKKIKSLKFRTCKDYNFSVVSFSSYNGCS